MDEVPIAEKGVVTHLEKMVGCKVLGEHLHSLPLVNQARQMGDEESLQIVSEEPSNQACGGWSHADRVMRAKKDLKRNTPAPRSRCIRIS
ncbi:hypothetical protein NPIL_400301 [Nephila pilipes]|uniref:Uncharacterized protein n=1 Tax=Nephila pilipes TaxID=299642 RepID=A0A8X6NAV6_NEPPI|nr:hypothetical protein NPIL_400301 [Nephila pilipes]